MDGNILQEDACAYESLCKRAAKQPLNKEIYRLILCDCAEPKKLSVLESIVAHYPEYKSATLSPFHLINFLVECKALCKNPLDVDGNEIREDILATLSEEDVFDLVEDYELSLTDVGEKYCSATDPSMRIRNAFEAKPQYSAIYREILNYCREPRSYEEVKAWIKNEIAQSDHLQNVVGKNDVSSFLGSMEQAGSLRWEGGWKTTAEGLAMAVEKE